MPTKLCFYSGANSCIYIASLATATAIGVPFGSREQLLAYLFLSVMEFFFFSFLKTKKKIDKHKKILLLARSKFNRIVNIILKALTNDESHQDLKIGIKKVI